MEEWHHDSGYHVIVLDSSVQGFNLFLYELSSSQVNWFDLGVWDVEGDCYLDGTLIRH